MGLRAGASSQASPLGQRAGSAKGLSTAELKRELRRREGPKPHEAAAESAEETANATELRKAAFGRFENAMAAELKQQSATLLNLGSDHAVTLDMVEKTTLSVFEWLSRVMLEAGHELQDADKSVARAELKAQHSALMSKLETSRSAAAVNLSATKVEMDAAATKMLEEKVEEMRESDVRELERAKAELHELGDAHNALVTAHKISEESLKTANQLQRSTFREMKAAEEQYADLKRDAAAAKRALDEQVPHAITRAPSTVTVVKQRSAPPVSTQMVEGTTTPPGGDAFGGFRKLFATSSPSRVAGARSSISSAASQANSVGSAELDADNDEERSLSDGVGAIVGALKAARAQRDLATASLQEASHEAERVAMMHAVELREAVEAALQSEREASESQLGRLSVEMRAMAAMHAETDGELTRACDALKKLKGSSEGEELRAALEMSSGLELADENKRLKVEVGRLASETEDARKQVDAILSQLNFAIDEKASLSEVLQELGERFECAETQIRWTKASLDEALSKLGWRRDENASLSAQVKQLADEYGAARDELARSKREVAEALVSLSVQVDTNCALDEQVASLLEKLNQLAIEADKGRVLHEDVEDIRTRLHSTLATVSPKVSTLASTRYVGSTLSLREQVDELVEHVGVLEKLDALRSAALAKSETQYHELVQSSKDFEVRVMTHAESMVHKVQDEARFKRAELVETALSSLGELRKHLTHTGKSIQLDDAFSPLANAVPSTEVALYTFARRGPWGSRLVSLPTQTKLERLVVKRLDVIRDPDMDLAMGALRPTSSPSRGRARSQELPTPPQGAPASQSVGASPRAQRARAKSQEYRQAIGQGMGQGMGQGVLGQGGQLGRSASPNTAPRVHNAGASQSAMLLEQQIPRPSTAPEPANLSPPPHRFAGHNPMYRLDVHEM